MADVQHEGAAADVAAVDPLGRDAEQGRRAPGVFAGGGDPVDVLRLQAGVGDGVERRVEVQAKVRDVRDDAELRGVPPPGRRVRVTDILYRGGAGWVTALLGSVMLMPGMSYETCAARRLGLEPQPAVFGGYVVKNLH